MVRHLRTGPAAAGMTQQREVPSFGQTDGCVLDRELAEFDEMVAAPTGPELTARAVLHARRHCAHVPVCVQDVVVTSIAKARSHSEAGLTFERRGESRL